MARKNMWDNDKALISALNAGFNKVAKAIREAGGSGITQEQIDKITAQVIANREKIHEAQETKPSS